MIVASEAGNYPFIVKMSSNKKKMKKQGKVFSTDEKMQILVEAVTHMGTRVDVAAMLGLSVLIFNTTVSKGSEI
jgi:hypothetical protein